MLKVSKRLVKKEGFRLLRCLTKEGKAAFVAQGRTELQVLTCPSLCRWPLRQWAAMGVGARGQRDLHKRRQLASFAGIIFVLPSLISIPKEEEEVHPIPTGAFA